MSKVPDFGLSSSPAKVSGFQDFWINGIQLHLHFK